MSVFTLESKGIKFNSASDIEPFLHDVKDEVTEIRLSGNTFGVEASQALSRVLRDKTHLQDAQMADIFTGRLREEIPAALEALLPALASCLSLKTVNLCDNAFGPTAAAPLEAFFETHSALQHLHLQNNGMGPEAGARMARALARNSKGALQTLICGRNRLENGSVAAWIECFAAHKQDLRVVKMPQNGIRPEGIEFLMRDGLAQCKNLRIVDMQDNTFTQRGSVALANALPNWQHLEELAIGDCLLSARGARVVAEALAKGANKNLKILRLQYNEIDASALSALKTAIQGGLPKLTTLELNGNKFTEDDESLQTIRTIFENRGFGELDELDDLEEESDEDEGDADDDDDDDSQQEEDEVKSEAVSLDAAIEKNIAAMSGMSMNSSAEQ